MTKFLFLFITLTPAFLWSQTFSVSGQITDENTPLSFVTIVISQETDTMSEATSSTFTGQVVAATISDDDGQFMISDLPQGRYNVNAQILGYSAYSQVITLGPSLELGRISLSPSQEQLQEVTVTARTPQITRAPGRLTSHSANLNPIQAHQYHRQSIG